MNDERRVIHQQTPHEPHDAIAAYALGLLEPDEQVVLEAHLASCATCQAELARHEDVVGQLGALATPVEPRPEARAALLSEIRASSATPAAPTPFERRVPASWLVVAASVAIFAVAILGFFLNQTLQDRDDARNVEQEIAEYLANGGFLSALRPAPGAPPDVAAGHGTLAVAPDQSGAMLIVYGLPPTNDDLRYVAWAERDGDRVDLGELTVNEQGVGSLKLYGPDPIVSYETVGITRFTPDSPDGEPYLVAPVE